MADIPEDIAKKLREKLNNDQDLYDKLYKYSVLENDLDLIERQEQFIEKKNFKNLEGDETEKQRKIANITENINTKAEKQKRQEKLRNELLSSEWSATFTNNTIYFNFKNDERIKKYLPLHFFTFKGYNESPPEYTIWEKYNSPLKVINVKKEYKPIGKNPTLTQSNIEYKEQTEQFKKDYKKFLVESGVNVDAPKVLARPSGVPELVSDWLKNKFRYQLKNSINKLTKTINGDDDRPAERKPNPLNTKQPSRQKSTRPEGYNLSFFNSHSGGKRKPKKFSVKKKKKGKRSKSGRRKSKRAKNKN